MAPAITQVLPCRTLRLGAAPSAVDLGRADGAIAGVAVWFPPGAGPSVTGLSSLPAYFRALGRHLGTASQFASAAARAHPRDQPNWCLAFIGIEPARQGQGIESALMRTRLETPREPGSAGPPRKLKPGECRALRALRLPGDRSPVPARDSALRPDHVAARITAHGFTSATGGNAATKAARTDPVPNAPRGPPSDLDATRLRPDASRVVHDDRRPAELPEQIKPRMGNRLSSCSRALSKTGGDPHTGGASTVLMCSKLIAWMKEGTGHARPREAVLLHRSGRAR